MYGNYNPKPVENKVKILWNYNLENSQNTISSKIWS